MATKATRPEDAASDWAQGGIATTRDDPDSLKADVLAASGDTADPEAVEVLVENAGDAVEDVLIDTLGIEFDTVADPAATAGSERTDPDGGEQVDPDGGEQVDPDGGEQFEYAREAAHSIPRVLHVDAATGKHVLRPFLSYLDDHDGVTIREDTAALELITHEGRAHGAVLDFAPTGEPVFAGATVLATGGIGACYRRTTNPAGATGDGIAMAALAGADVADMEYVQFHPTAYVPGADGGGTADGQDTFLVSEAVRGAGAHLLNGDGERFMPDYHADAELAPRDVVARAVADERERTGEVRLDVSNVDFRERFPGLATKCDDRGVDPDAGIPVAPAEHYLCGGITVDRRGRASLDRLLAAGECARTGVHGANRLASTSLLEGLVWGLRAGETAAEAGDPDRVEPPELLDRDPELPPRFAAEKLTRLRRVMDEHVGLRRSPEGLRRASAVLRRLKGEVDAYVRTRTARSLYELRNASVTALLVARAAGENPRSKGCHHLIDAEGGEAPESTEPEAPAGD